MIDSFITYEPNPAGENSPDFFSKHLNEIFSYNFMETEDLSLLPSSGLPPVPEEVPCENLIDHFGADSAYSTNPSTKHSPEYTPNEEDQESDNQKYVPSKVPPITKKGIKKHYEPILDNGILYRYDEDPEEYKKARKRIQNRESATRVRNRKRTRAEELEDEVKILNQEKAELKVKNASLVAENTTLRQQIGRLERMISGFNQDEVDSINNTSRTDAEPDSIINLITKPDEDLEYHPPSKLTRVSPAHNFKKHVAMLGVFTLLLCVYGFLPRTQGTGNIVTLFSNKSLFSSRSTPFGRQPTNAISVGLKPHNTLPNVNMVPQDMPGNLRTGDPGDGWISYVVEIAVLACYLAYLIYVGISFYKYRALRKKAYAYTPL